MRGNPLRFVMIGGLVALLAVGFGVALVVRNLKGSLEGVRRVRGTAASDAADGSSLLRARNLEKAIAKLRARIGPEGQVHELGLEPKTARFQVRQGSTGKPRGWAYTSDGDLSSFPVKLIGSGKIADAAFPLGGVPGGDRGCDPQAGCPGLAQGRAAHHARPRHRWHEVRMERERRRRRVRLAVPGRPRWEPVRKPGVDGTDPKAAIAKADMIVRCLARAGRDVAKIQACSR